MTDWAQEVLGGEQPTPEKAAPAKHDWASILDAPTTDEPQAGLYETPSGRAPGTVRAPVSGRGVGFLEGLKMNIPADQETRRRIVAKALFPDDPKGIERVGSKNGRPVFVNDGGELEYADAGAMTKLGGWLANLPEIAGSIAGSVTPAGPIGGAVVGGVAGKGWKQVLSNLLFDEPQTVGGNAADMAQEGVVNAVGGLAAKGFSAAYSRNAVRNAERFDKASADKLIDRIHQQTGIKLDYAQAGNLPQLRNLKKWAAKYPSEAQEIIEALDKEQADQVATAIEQKILGALSKTEDPAALATSGVNAARAAIDAAKIKRDAVVRPLYEKAYKDTVDVATLREIKKADPVIGQAIQRIKSDPLYKRDLAGAPDNSIRMLDLVKRDLDDQIEKAINFKEGNRARILTQTKNDLLTYLDTWSPAYKAARGEFEKLSASLVDPLEKGTLGVLAKIEGPKMAQTAAQVIDDLTKNPQAVTAVKTVLTNNQGAQGWNDLLKLSLANKFNKALTETQSGDPVNAAGKFRQAVIGSPRQKQAMQNAIGATGVQAFDDIMEAVQLIAKDLRNRPASDTAAFQAIERQQAEKAVPLLRSIGAKVARGANPLAWAEALEGAGRERLLQDNAVKIAEALSDPKQIGRLSELRKLKPTPERAIAILSVAGLGIPLERVTDDVASSAPDVAPRAPQPQP